MRRRKSVLGWGAEGQGSGTDVSHALTTGSKPLTVDQIEKSKTIRLLERDIRECLHDSGAEEDTGSTTRRGVDTEIERYY